MGLISIEEAEMSGQTVEVAQGEEVKRREGKDANKTNERTWRTNKNPLGAERNGGNTQRFNENFSSALPAEKVVGLLTSGRY